MFSDDSVPIKNVVLPLIRKPPVVASFVTEKLFLVNAEETIELSSLETIARINFIHSPPFAAKFCLDFIIPQFSGDCHSFFDYKPVNFV